jgi:hypothetical protein
MNIKHWFKKYFIPHEGNNHQPHILRKDAIFFIGILAFSLEILFLFHSLGVIPIDKFTASILPNALVDETNTARVSDSLSPLKPNTLLESAAQDKANDMAKNGYFAHTSPTGITPWYWFQKVGYNFIYAGENLAVNFVDSSDVMNAWMNSPEHKANILNSHFTQIGIATANGTYEGRPAVFAVQLFGTPASTASVSAPAKVVANIGTSTLPVTTEPVTINESSSITDTGAYTFVAVKGAESMSSSTIESTANTPLVKESNSVVDTLASPRKTINYLLYALAVFVFITLILNIFIRMEIQHGYLIVNGLLIIIFISGILAFNSYVSFYQIKIL